MWDSGRDMPRAVSDELEPLRERDIRNGVSKENMIAAREWRSFLGR